MKSIKTTVNPIHKPGKDKKYMKNYLKTLKDETGVWKKL